MTHTAHVPALAVALLAAVPAAAVIQRLYPLGDILADADMVVAARVEGLDRRRHVATVRRVSALKGQPAWTTARFRLAGGGDRSQVAVLEARLAPGRSVVLFGKTRRFLLGYAEGTWFRIAAPADERRGPWQFVHLEPHLRRTFRGRTAELQQTVRDVLSGKKTAPAPDVHARPGF